MKSLLDEASCMQVDIKEREQISSVVETAQDWIERVREAMNSEEEATLKRLEGLLVEADDIPVNMDEHQLLLCEIKARKWTAEVQKTLKKNDCRVNVLKNLLDEFESIREAMPLDSRAKKNYSLEEEVQLRTIVERVDSWRATVKRAMHSKRGTTLAKFQILVDEVSDIPVNLQAEVRPIESILKKAAEWREIYADLITVCLAVNANNTNTLSSTTSSDESIETKEKMAVAFTTLEACIASGEKVNALLEEMESLKALLNSGKAWLEKLDLLCPKRQTKRTSSKSSKPSEAEICEHMNMADTLPFDFKVGVSRLKDSIDTAHDWQVKAKKIYEELTLEFDEEIIDDNSNDDDFPDVDDDVLERLKVLSRDAEIMLVQTEEEVVLERYLGVYSWGQDVRALLETNSSKCTLAELDRIVKVGNELYSREDNDDTQVFPPFMRSILNYGSKQLASIGTQLHATQSWVKTAKKVIENSGISLKQASDLLTKVIVCGKKIIADNSKYPRTDVLYV